ncbi:VOC family protein [Dactylosporangium sp. McL0621]|uniref:VOC family protein n=1 Tax=Dactylosporangium sp. McL0621 TaxID=3415678 RepID=UPI003CF99DE9
MTDEPPVISVMLIVPDADGAVSWYRTALGATELWNRGGVAGLDIGGAAFFLHQADPDNPAGVSSTRVEVFTDDPDHFVERAVAAGAVAGPPIEDRRVPWGTHRQGGFTDPYGHKWSVGDRSPLRRWS